MNFEIDRSSQPDQVHPNQQDNHPNIDRDDEDTKIKTTSDRTDEFLKTFNERIKSYQLSPDPNQLTLIKASLNEVAKELPSYHLKNCINQLSTLSSLQPTQQETKKKFSFKRIPTTITTTGKDECKPNQAESPKEEIIESNHDFQISNQAGILFKPTDSMKKFQSFLINDIQKSILDLRSLISLKSISIKNLSNSVLIIDQHLHGSLQISHSFDSILIFSSNQIRVHDSKRLLFWVQCNTAPIIERCEKVNFNSKNQSDPIKQVLDFSQPVLLDDQNPNYTLNSLNPKIQVQDILEFIDQFDFGKDDLSQIENSIQEFIKKALDF